MEVVYSVLLSQLILDYEACLERIPKSSNLLDFPSNAGIVVVSDFGILEILLMLFWKFAELLLFANC